MFGCVPGLGTVGQASITALVSKIRRLGMLPEPDGIGQAQNQIERNRYGAYCCRIWLYGSGQSAFMGH